MVIYSGFSHKKKHVIFNSYVSLPEGNGFGRILFLFMEMSLIQHYELVK